MVTGSFLLQTEKADYFIYSNEVKNFLKAVFMICLSRLFLRWPEMNSTLLHVPCTPEKFSFIGCHKFAATQRITKMYCIHEATGVKKIARRNVVYRCPVAV